MLEDENKFDLHLYVSDDLEGQEKELFSNHITIHQVDYQIDFPEIKRFDHITRATFLRLNAVENLAEDYDRILYLDVDIFLEKRSLGTLLSQDLKGEPLAAVRDCSYWPGRNRPYVQRRNLTRHGIGGGSIFNAGVLLFDGAKLRQQKYLAEAREILRKHPDNCPQGDQSALNIVFDGAWTELSPVWNWQYRRKGIALAQYFRPNIIHFIGPIKPWNDPDHIIEKYFLRDMILFLMETAPDMGRMYGEKLQLAPENLTAHLESHQNAWNGASEVIDVWKEYIEGFSENKNGS